jgi:PAS domain S-box-containing protein
VKTKTKIVIVEHNLSDIELILYELKKGGINNVSEIVQTEQDYSNVLKNFIPDIILCDYSLPAFDGSTAFKIKQQLVPDIPFIFVSGSIGEENSIEYIKNGVTDYVLKDKMFTLATKVKRALQEAKEKQQKDRIEKIIKDERILLRTLIDNLPVIVYTKDIQSRKTLSNRTDYEYIGVKSEEEVLGKDDFSFFSAKTAGITAIEEQQLFSSGQPIYNIEEHQKKKDDSMTWFLKSKIPLRNQDNEIVGLIGISYDITERKEAEQQKEFDRNNLNALINNTNDQMWSVDKDFKLITSNQPFDETIRLMSGRAITKGSSILAAGYSQEQINRYKESYERAFAGESFTQIECADIPVELWSEISYYPIRKGDEIIGTACYSRDISRLKLAELERIKITNDLIQRNKDLEQFAYIISHNLRAPVANIIGIANAIHSLNLDQEKEKQMKKHLVTSVKKLDEVINDLNHILQVKHDVSEEKEIVRFSELLADIQLSIISLIQKEDVHFIINFADVEEMQTLKSYLYSIFFNLISNSIKYRSPHTRPVIEITSKKTGNKIEFIFKDNGLGIDLKKRGEQVFGLYKRFHSHTEGKGMGLYMVKAQVETLGGKISVRSEVNQGTEFRIEFDNKLKAVKQGPK